MYIELHLAQRKCIDKCNVAMKEFQNIIAIQMKNANLPIFMLLLKRV